MNIDHVEFYVLDNVQAARFYQTALGFQVISTPELTSNSKDRSSIVLGLGNIRLVLTSPLGGFSSVAEHIQVHGDGIRDIALTVTNVEELFERAIAKGARAIAGPSTSVILGERRRTAAIGVFGDVVHTLIEENPARNTPLRRDTTYKGAMPLSQTGIEGVDHLAFALKMGELDKWVDFYVNALSFQETHQENVSTEYSAMRSKVVQTENGSVKFPMMEPAIGKRKSQIEHYIESHNGPGTQHLAFLSADIVVSVSAMLAAGIQFLPTPEPYYEQLEARVGSLSDLERLKKHGVLVDRDAAGLLLQVFTKPIGLRPTLFLEVIERRGAEGFGSGNIKALFEAVERAQAAHARM